MNIRIEAHKKRFRGLSKKKRLDWNIRLVFVYLKKILNKETEV